MRKAITAGLCVISLFLISACATSAQVAEATASESVAHAEVNAAVDRMVTEQELPGAVLIVEEKGRRIHAYQSGAINEATVLNFASATKWVSAAAILAEAQSDPGRLHAPLDAVLPWPEGQPVFSLRDALSHTSGTKVNHAVGDRLDVPLQARAMELVAQGSESVPGSAFAYGGASFQVAGAAAEKWSGSSWRTLYETRIAKPLGMEGCYYAGPLRDALAASVTNPNLGSGLYCSAQEYMKFLRAMASGQPQILAKPAQLAMRRAFGKSVIRRDVPAMVPPGWSYGIGVWCEEVDHGGQCDRVSSLGAWGTYPWIDYRTGRYGILVTRGRAASLMPYILELNRQIAALPAD